MSASERIRIVITSDDQGMRLDQILAARVPGLSRRKARVLIDIGGVFVDRARVKVASRMLRPGQSVEVHLGGALERATASTGREARARDEATLPDFFVIYEDDDLVVVDKPARLLTAPTPESDRQNLSNLLSQNYSGEIFVVHRLDLETSGVLVFARTAEANRVLSETFRVHNVDRRYRVFAAGAVAEESFTAESPIAGRKSVTHFRRVAQFADLATELEATLETGRTHQIRIHAARRGYPVLGDRRYGVATDWDPPRMALHAAHLGLAHPRSGAALQFSSPLPRELEEWRLSVEERSQSGGPCLDGGTVHE